VGAARIPPDSAGAPYGAPARLLRRAGRFHRREATQDEAWDYARAGGYAQLLVNAHRLRVGEVEVVAADLADVIRSKESARRLAAGTGRRPLAAAIRRVELTPPRRGPPGLMMEALTWIRSGRYG